MGQRFADFTERLSATDRALSLLSEYPVLARRLADCTENWLNVSAEFLEQEREQLGPLIFAQEYLCEFHDEVGSAFLADLIAATLTDSFPPLFPPTHWAHSHGR